MSRAAAELIRKRYAYRRLILRGRVSLPHEAAVRLVGPDCAYHLYAHGRAQQTAQCGSAADPQLSAPSGDPSQPS